MQFVVFIRLTATHTHTHTHNGASILRHPKLFKDVFFPFVLIVIQPLLGAVLLHTLCCNSHNGASIFKNQKCFFGYFDPENSLFR